MSETNIREYKLKPSSPSLDVNNSETTQPQKVGRTIQEEAYFDILFSKNNQLSEDNTPESLDAYEEYLEEFKKQYRVFAEYCENVVGETRCGGLIPNEYIELWGNTHPDVQEYIRNTYFSQDKIYRGARVEDQTRPEDLLACFIKPVGITCGYRPLTKTQISAISLKELPKDEIRENLRRYNAAIIDDVIKNTDTNLKIPEEYSAILLNRSREAYWYLPDEEPSIKLLEQKAINEGRYVEYMLTAHTTASPSRIWKSPAVSTSYEKHVAYRFKGKGFTPGVVITGLLPKQGIFYTHSADDLPLINQMGEGNWDEYEYLIMGGMDPNSIQKIELYFGNTLEAIAQRTADNHLNLVKIHSQESITYKFTTQGTLELVSKEKLELEEVENYKKEVSR